MGCAAELHAKHWRRAFEHAAAARHALKPSRVSYKVKTITKIEAIVREGGEGGESKEEQ